MFQLGKETVLTALGKKWTFGRLTLAVLLAFRDWIREEVGDPFAVAERFAGKLPAEEWLPLFKAAEATAKELESFTLATDVAQRFLKTERGAAKIGQLLLAEHHPGVTEEEALQILLEIGTAGLDRAIRRGTGKAPEKNAPSPAA